MDNYTKIKLMSREEIAVLLFATVRPFVEEYSVDQRKELYTAYRKFLDMEAQ